MELKKFRIKIFADGAENDLMLQMAKNSIIAGFTTNPTLMRKAGIKDYKAFAKEILSQIQTKTKANLQCHF